MYRIYIKFNKSGRWKEVGSLQEDYVIETEVTNFVDTALRNEFFSAKIRIVHDNGESREIIYEVD